MNRSVWLSLVCTLLCFLTVEAGSLPKFNEKLESGKQPPQVGYEVPYLQNEIAEQYSQLAVGTEGRYYSAIDEPLIEVIRKVLEENLVAGADVVFVIDHTSSMKDDIDEVRANLKTIVEQLAMVANVRLGAVSFSDVKSGSEYGYRRLDLSADYSPVGHFLDEIELLGSVEDIYGAVWKTVDEFDWKSPTKRMIVVIGDEKPATGRESNYTEADVFAKCAEKGINTRLYPVLIDKFE